MDIKYVFDYQQDLTDTRTEVLVLETTEYFSDTEYKNTDTIIIKNYRHYASETQDCQLFNEYINRTKGHKILKTSSDDPQKFLKNRIHIARPAFLDKQNGSLTEEGWFTVFKEDVLDDQNTIDNITTYDTGRLINVDLQNMYFFQITTKEHIMNLETERV